MLLAALIFYYYFYKQIYLKSAFAFASKFIQKVYRLIGYSIQQSKKRCKKCWCKSENILQNNIRIFILFSFQPALLSTINRLEIPGKCSMREKWAFHPILLPHYCSIHPLNSNEYWLGHICHGVCTLCWQASWCACVCVYVYQCVLVHECLCVCEWVLWQLSAGVSPGWAQHSTTHLQDPLTPAFSPGTNNMSLDLVQGGYMVLMFNKQHTELGLPSRTLGVITSYPS